MSVANDPFGWVGATLDGKVAVERLVGEGGFGVVYRGTHLGFREPVAVKCLRLPAALEEAQQRSFLAAFTEEARLLHRLSKASAGIVQALDVGAARSPLGVWTPYIVMEWLEGETLEAHLAARHGQPPLGVDAALELLAPAAEALAVAHAQGVAHRDVKPANLFLARIGTGATLKVLDFGIAKVLEQNVSITQAYARTGSETRAFSPQYAAPEQFDPRFGATGPWTDVYAFALVLLEAASGRMVNVASTPLQLYVAATDDRRRPSFASVGVVASPAIEAVVARALAVDPTQRHPTLDLLWHALQEARTITQARTLLVGDIAAQVASVALVSVRALPGPTLASEQLLASEAASAPEQGA